jgi:hypothetical protein
MGIGRIAAVCAACAAPGFAAWAGPGVFRTAAGVEVATPALEGLDCAAMRRLLDALDASGYRRGPAPVDPADIALLHYEDRLSTVYYRDCVEIPAHAAAPEAAFGLGFVQDGQ